LLENICLVSAVYFTVLSLCATRCDHPTSPVETFKLMCFFVKERSPTIIIITFNARVRLTIKLTGQTKLRFLFIFSFVVCLIGVLSRHHLVLQVTLSQFLLFTGQFQLEFSVLFFCLLDLEL